MEVGRSLGVRRLNSVSIIVLVLFAAGVHSFYVPVVAPRDFANGDELRVKVNKLTSNKTRLPYNYYSLPYCRPDKIVDSTENLGEVLRGDRIENSPFEFKMKQPKMCSVVCRIVLNAKTAKEFKEKIEDEYRVNMILDNLPVVMPIRRPGQESVVYQRGFHVGFKGPDTGNKEGNVYIHNHLSFTVRYHKDTETEALRIVGFHVIPYSVKHKYEGDFGNTAQWITCNPAAKRFVTIDDPPQVVEDKQEIVFTYDVDFQESAIEWASRWDAYSLMADDQIHWFSAVNSLMILLFLSGMVAMIMLQTLYRMVQSRRHGSRLGHH